MQLEAGEFHYTDYGDRTAPTLVLLHGMPSDRTTSRLPIAMSAVEITSSCDQCWQSRGLACCCRPSIGAGKTKGPFGRMILKLICLLLGCWLHQ